MGPGSFLLFNLALAFYNVGTIWAHEVDIFRSWTLIRAEDFHAVQSVHWRKLPYWIFAPVGLALVCGFGLTLHHPPGSPLLAIYGALICQVLAIALTAVFWGHWQGQLAKDPLGSGGVWLHKILRTHWIGTLLISGYAMLLLNAAIIALGP
jgi:hypothetical protein